MITLTKMGVQSSATCARRIRTPHKEERALHVATEVTLQMRITRVQIATHTFFQARRTAMPASPATSHRPLLLRVRCAPLARTQPHRLPPTTRIAFLAQARRTATSAKQDGIRPARRPRAASAGVGRTRLPGPRPSMGCLTSLPGRLTATPAVLDTFQRRRRPRALRAEPASTQTPQEALRALRAGMVRTLR